MESINSKIRHYISFIQNQHNSNFFHIEIFLGKLLHDKLFKQTNLSDNLESIIKKLSNSGIFDHFERKNERKYIDKDMELSIDKSNGHSKCFKKRLFKESSFTLNKGRYLKVKTFEYRYQNLDYFPIKYDFVQEYSLNNVIFSIKNSLFLHMYTFNDFTTFKIIIKNYDNQYNISETLKTIFKCLNENINSSNKVLDK